MDGRCGICVAPAKAPWLLYCQRGIDRKAAAYAAAAARGLTRYAAVLALRTPYLFPDDDGEVTSG